MAITRTARGTGQNKASADPWTVMTNFVGAVGNRVVICIAADVSSITSITISQSGKTSTTSFVQDARTINSGNVYVHIQSAVLADTYDAATVSIDWLAVPAAMAAAVVELSGTGGTPALDTTTGDNASDIGTGTDASTASITSTPNSGLDVAWIGVVGTEGPNGDTAGTWVNPDNNGQRLGTTGGGAASNITVSEGYEIDSVEVTQGLSKTGMTSRDWAAALVTYKEPAASGALTVSVSDTVNNWVDSLSGMGRGYEFTDTVNNWSERQDIGIGLIFADELKRIGSFAGNAFDSAAFDVESGLLDYPEIGWGILLSDNLSNWLDAIETQLLGPLTVDVSDNANNWNDELSGMGRGYTFEDILTLTDEIKLQLDHLVSFSDTLILSDGTEINLAYLKEFSDSLNNWLDAIETSVAGFLEISASDSINNWSEVINLIYGYVKDISDNLNNFSDAITLILEHQLQLSDTLSQSDAIAIEEGLLISLSDNLNNWLDAQQFILDHLLQVSDSMNFADELLVNFSHELQLSDSLDNWADSVSTLLIFTSVLSASVSDNLNFWNDKIELSTALQRDIRNYLRRYLNDVIVADSSAVFTEIKHGIFKPELHTYLRRYLNDRSAEYLIHSMDSLNNWNDAISVGVS